MVKKFFLKVADLFGFTKSSKYIQNYLHKANIRSGIFMAAVVAILEIWLVIRQHQKYIIPAVQSGTNYFKSLFDNTSLFWLQMVMGISMFIYCLYYLASNNKYAKAYLISLIISSSIGIVLCCLLPLENRIQNFNPKRMVDTVLLICLYASILLFHLSTILAALTKYRNMNIEWLQSVLIITIFATCLLIFGIKVSYGDFTSTRTIEGVVVANPDYKEIICFLMMSIYVGCLLIWRPYISVAILGAVFLGFYFLLKSFDPNIRYFPDGDEVNYITFFISLAMVSVSIFSQRKHEAQKDEELELLATIDSLTGLYTYSYFLSLVDKKIVDEKLEGDDWAFLFFNISSFKVYNDQNGYEAGNEFLKNVGEIIGTIFPFTLISRQSDDHFVAFVKNINLTAKLDDIRAKVRDLDADIKPNIMTGYYIFQDGDLDSHVSIEKARYACAELKKRGGQSYLQYDQAMHDNYNLVQYIVSNIDEAIEKGWIVAYYQPVVYSKNEKLCGVEALARWIDPKYGFLNPGIFVPALEAAHIAYKLDLAILDIVCHNMRKVLDSGNIIVPTSINFSRGDFSIINVADEVSKITQKYNIPTEYLHIEITESALINEKENLLSAMKSFKLRGFALWLDDFGSGYSSFNSLKDYDFDVLKLDMEFLKGFDKNEKSKPLIESVLNMANQIGMRTLCEGVETKEQELFLKKIGCERLQGYLFSKPVSYEELNKQIADGKLVISEELI